jgi:hypothetical protein
MKLCFETKRIIMESWNLILWAVLISVKHAWAVQVLRLQQLDSSDYE